MLNAKKTYLIGAALFFIVACSFTGILVFNEYSEEEKMELATVYIENGYSVMIDGIKLIPEEIDTAGIHAGIYSVHDIDKDAQIVYLNKKIKSRRPVTMPFIIPQ